MIDVRTVLLDQEIDRVAPIVEFHVLVLFEEDKCALFIANVQVKLDGHGERDFLVRALEAWDLVLGKERFVCIVRVSGINRVQELILAKLRNQGLVAQAIFYLFGAQVVNPIDRAVDVVAHLIQVGKDMCPIRLPWIDGVVFEEALVKYGKVCAYELVADVVTQQPLDVNHEQGQVEEEGPGEHPHEPVLGDGAVEDVRNQGSGLELGQRLLFLLGVRQYLITLVGFNEDGHVALSAVGEPLVRID